MTEGQKDKEPKQYIRGNTACARACSLSKQSGERKARNKSAQGNALGIVRNQHSPRMGKRITMFILPLRHSLMVGCYSFAPSGAYPCCILSPRALPGAGISMPLRGVGSLTFRRICYPPESNIRILNPQYPAAQPRLKSAIGTGSLFIG